MLGGSKGSGVDLGVAHKSVLCKDLARGQKVPLHHRAGS